MGRDPTIVLVIPARYGSSRFPGKPLALLAGKPLLQHVYERASACPRVDKVLVATDDYRILEATQGFGGTALLTNGEVRSGTDRVAAVARTTPGQVFVNLQADEVPLHPNLLTDLVEQFQASGAPMGTLKRRFPPDHDVNDTDLVKVVTNGRDEALYFSRAPIPCERDRGGEVVASAALHYLHLGIYVYQRETLLHLAELPPGRLEEAEQLEQLRALEHRVPIRVWETAYPSLRIDRPEDLDLAASILNSLEACEGALADADP